MRKDVRSVHILYVCMARLLTCAIAHMRCVRRSLNRPAVTVRCHRHHFLSLRALPCNLGKLYKMRGRELESRILHSPT
ncbi:hypothetical protein BU23DRAFT_91586 [Bimuria novae-zelandiae CBS 107.79]|uniref:Uncharacterized protein n=1 Tax=Bimuria novae-zelandiae CBS 107.79 TaxID=1447943 RepID=A0A6A5VDE5_9PLEO|nr:hypothetical protein BU23DRAFT_91586 [Bimuria novae-zelandiae CBS 107.79]